MSRIAMLDYEKIHFNDALIYRELERRGVELSFVHSTDLIQAKFHSKTEYLLGSTSRLAPHIYVNILEDKFYTKQLLKQHSFPVATAKVFNWNQTNEALDYARNILQYPVVIKPTNNAGGQYVFCNISSDPDFRRIFSEISQVTVSPCIMVEKFIPKCNDYRFFVISDKTTSVVRRTPPKVIGNGHSTIRELVDAENHRRMNPRNTCLCPIRIDDSEAIRCLKNHGFNLSSVPMDNEVIQCRNNANVSQGGDCENVLDLVHPSYFQVCKNIHALFPGLPFIVIDLLIEDPSLAANNNNYVVCECCCLRPGLSLHTHPGKGKAHDIVSPLVDILFPETANDRTDKLPLSDYVCME